MSRIHVAFVLFTGVALAYGANLLVAPDAMPVRVGEVATPNHDPYHLSLAQSVATPNHDPHHVGLIQVSATPDLDAHPVDLVQIAATPNHDSHHVSLVQNAVPAEMVAWEPVILHAEPEAAAPSAPVFVAADTMLYARANARLRAAPSTAAGVVTKLAADAPLRAIAHSTDGVWWQVSIAGKRTGYVRRDAVTKVRAVKTNPPVATIPVAIATASPDPEPPARPSHDLLGRVTEAMNWLADRAGPGPAPKIIRTER